jgi:hypothetical protein
MDRQSENFPGCPAPTAPGEGGVFIHASSSVVPRDEVTAPPIRVAQPLVRRRGGAPRRGHVGARRRPAVKRVAVASRAGPDSRGDPDLGDEPPGDRSPLRVGVAV